MPRHLLLSLALAITLGAPLALTTWKGSRYEPYPALLLPAGSNTARLGAKQFEYRQIYLLAKPVGKAGWTDVPLNETFPRIRATRIQAILRAGAGLHSAAENTDDYREMVTWWRGRLRRAGYQNDEIRVQTRQLTVYPGPRY